MSAAALAWQQLRFERKQFWRNPSAAFFTVILPLLFLVLIATAFSVNDEALRVLVPGIAGMTVMASTFNGLIHAVVFLREEGILKRVRGTPMPIASYLGGVLGSAVVNAAIALALVLAVGNLVYGVEWPQDPFLLAAFALLGVTCFGALGVAFANAIPNSEAAPAYQNAVFLPLIFISGVFYGTDSLPRALEVFAQALPLKPLVDGLSAAIVNGGADIAADAAIVAAWAVAGLFLAVRFFRWE